MRHNYATNPSLETGTTGYATTGGVLTSGGTLTNPAGGAVGTKQGHVAVTASGQGVSFTAAPAAPGRFKLLAQRPVDPDYKAFVLSKSPAFYLALDSTDGFTDLSGNGHNGTATGGVTAGSATGPHHRFNGVGTRTNYVTNPNLETNATGWSSYASRATCARVSTQAYDGTYSYEAICPGTITAEGTVITGTAGLTPSVTYSARVWVKAPLGATMTMSVQEYTTAVGYVGQTTVNFTGTGAWQEVTGSRAFGATGTRCFVSVLTATTAQAITFYTDCCLVEQAAAAGVYFPTTAQLASGEARWLGTADASGSELAVQASGATTFDGTNDALTTTYSTRRNGVPNPDFVGSGNWVAATSAWGAGTMTWTRNTDPTGTNFARIDGTHDATSGDHQTQFDSSPHNAAPAFPVTPGESVRAKIELRHQLGGPYSSGVNGLYHLYVMYFTAAGAYVTATTTSTGVITSYTTGQWVPVETVTGTVPATAAWAKISVRWRSSTPNEVYRHDIRRPQLEKASSALGTYFSGAGYVDGSGTWQTSNGACGWTGTANASASEVGPLAGGTPRTFMFWLNRDPAGYGTGRITLGNQLGGAGQYDVVLQFSSTSATLYMGGTAAVTWSGLPAAGAYNHYMIVVDKTAVNRARLYVNGLLHTAETDISARSWYGGTTTQNLQVGRYAESQYTYGKMGGVSVHYSALTATDAANAFASGRAEFILASGTTELGRAVAGTAWTQLDFPVSSGSQTLSIRTIAPRDFEFDAVQVGDDIDYRDGNHPGWEWTGTPDASTSQSLVGPDARHPILTIAEQETTMTIENPTTTTEIET